MSIPSESAVEPERITRIAGSGKVLSMRGLRSRLSVRLSLHPASSWVAHFEAAIDRRHDGHHRVSLLGDSVLFIADDRTLESAFQAIDRAIADANAAILATSPPSVG